MDRYDTLRAVLLIVFLGVFVSGIAVTINNYHRWSSVKTSVVAEYKKIQKAAENNLNNDISPGEESTYTDNADESAFGITGIDDESDSSHASKPAEHSVLNEYIAAESTEVSVNSENPAATVPVENEINNKEQAEEKISAKENMEGFYISEITDDIFARIQGKSFPESCTVTRDELRYIHVRHYGFEGEVCEGELIVNAAIAQDVLEIFEELYAIGYRIEKIRLIDVYGADDELSMEDNNSSCFNYRTIAESSTLSNHAYGRAIDINPFYNPYVYERADGSIFLQPKGSDKYIDRSVDASCVIKKGDACYNIFISHGFTWGGDWNTKKDYQHFEKTE